MGGDSAPVTEVAGCLLLQPLKLDFKLDFMVEINSFKMNLDKDERTKVRKKRYNISERKGDDYEILTDREIC